MRKGQMFKFGKYIYLVLVIAILAVGCGNRNSVLTNQTNDLSDISSESSDEIQEVAVIPVDMRIETDRGSQDVDNVNEDTEADITENMESDTVPEMEDVKVEEYGNEIWNHIHELLSSQDLDRGNNRDRVLNLRGTSCYIDEQLYYSNTDGLFENHITIVDGDVYSDDKLIIGGEIWNINFLHENWIYTTRRGEDTVLVQSELDGSNKELIYNFGSTVKQLYFLSDNEFLYLQDSSIHYHNLLNDTDCVIFRHEDIYSFVPTKTGIIYALGEANRHAVYMDKMVLAPYCDYYSVIIKENCEYMRLGIDTTVTYIKTEDIRNYLVDNIVYGNSGNRVSSPMQYKGDAYDSNEMGLTVNMYDILFPDDYFDEVMKEYTEKKFGQEWEKERREYITGLLYDCTDLDKANTRDEILNNSGTMLSTGNGFYYANSEGLFLTNSDSDKMIQYSDVWNLNYIDDNVYYTIKYCDFTGLFETDGDGDELKLKTTFNDKIKQLYFIGDTDILYLDNNGIHYQSFGGEGYFDLVKNNVIYSFAPSKYGIISARGNEDGFSLYMEEMLIATDCDYYTIYNQEGIEYLKYNSKGETFTVKTEEFTDIY